MNWFSSSLQAKRRFCTMALLLGLCGYGARSFAQPRINEFLAVNNRGLTDKDGEEADWIEIYNPGAKAVPLGGWALMAAAMLFSRKPRMPASREDAQ